MCQSLFICYLVNCPQDGILLSLLVKNLAVNCSFTDILGEARELNDVWYLCYTQVAEEVGELKVHCCYGCQLKDLTSGEYEPDPQGM